MSGVFKSTYGDFILKHVELAKKGFKTCKVRPIVKAKAWVEVDGRSFLGIGRANLLKEIEQTGSISAAAACAGISYRTAWSWILKMNKKVGCPLVETTKGGRGGGGAKLTPAGKTVLETYNNLADKLRSFIDETNAEFLG
jgi:molybdate transport system regulatory protein